MNDGVLLNASVCCTSHVYQDCILGLYRRRPWKYIYISFWAGQTAELRSLSLPAYRLMFYYMKSQPRDIKTLSRKTLKHRLFYIRQMEFENQQKKILNIFLLRLSGEFSKSSQSVCGKDPAISINTISSWKSFSGGNRKYLITIKDLIICEFPEVWPQICRYLQLFFRTINTINCIPYIK